MKRSNLWVRGSYIVAVLVCVLTVGWLVQRQRTDAGFVFHDEGTPGLLDARHFKILSEKQIEQTFRFLLSRHKPKQVVVDVGMNSGYFTLLSAALGAHVYAFDLQVYCIKVVTELLRNKNPHLLSRIDIFNVGLGTPAVVKVPNNTCEGTFGTGGVASASSLLTAGEVVASIVNPANLLPTWRDEVTLVKIDTEGAEADILANLLPIVEAGSVKNIVVELIPAHWPSRGSSLEAGIKTMERLEALASRVVLLYDPVGFDFPKSPMKIAGFDGDLYTKFSVSALVRDRHDKKAGCNVWFTF